MTAGLFALAAAAVALPVCAQSQQPDQAQTQTAQPAPKTDKKPAPKSTTVKGVTVTAAPPPVRLDIDRRSYDISKDLQTQAGASIADALRNVPSVNVDLDGKVTLRGESGVTILVDGKPSPMINPDTIQSLPADQFERVEVMTNPSAAFSPEGTAGIINLITKKRAPDGRRATLKASVADSDRWHIGAFGSNKSGPVTVSLNANTNRTSRSSDHSGVGQSIDPTDGVETSNTGHGDNIGKSTSENGGGSVRWEVDPKSQFTVALFGYEITGRSHADNTSVLSDATGAVTDDILTTRESLRRVDGLHEGAEYRHDFAGDDHNLVIDLGFDQRDVSSLLTGANSFAAPVQPDSFQRTNSDDDEHDVDFEGDYVRPMPAGAKLKAGWSIVQNDHLLDTSGFVAAPSPTSPDDPAQTDRYHFRRTVSAAYLTYQQPIGKLTVLGGLRVEGETLDIDDLSTNTDVRTNDAHLYPTLHLLYALNDSQGLFANYSERIERPDYYALNPFLKIYGPLSESQGNPHLRPEQTQDFETGWQYNAGGASYIATAYYKLNTGGFASITTDIGDGVLLGTQQNFTRSRDAGFELAASGRLPHDFSYNLSGVYHWNQIDGSPLDFTVTRSGSTISGNGSINWQADPADYLQFNFSAPGRTFTPQGFEEQRPVINLGYRRKFTDHLALVVTALDVFQTAGSRYVNDSPLLHGQGSSQDHDRTLYLTLVYTLGGPRREPPPTFDYGDQGGAH